MFQHTAARRRLAIAIVFDVGDGQSFNTQPPEGGWTGAVDGAYQFVAVSTHSRPKAAGEVAKQSAAAAEVSTHSRPKAAGNSRLQYGMQFVVSTHSRPKAAGPSKVASNTVLFSFQHTAARRRLAI